jgi:hypothetical protein
VPPAGDDQVTHFDTRSLGVIDPEGITINPNNGYLYLVGDDANMLAMLTTEGILIQMIDISAANAQVPAGLSWAPGSLNPAVMDIYITDRGVDNNEDPNENDGKVYELSITSKTLPLHDTKAPVVTAFDVPPTHNSLTVPILSFAASDNLGVAGYLVTESAAAPSADTPSWSATTPASYTVSGEGSRTLYGWAKDAAGNVSASLSDTVTVSLPEMFLPLADAQVDQNKPTLNFGFSVSLNVKTQGKRIHSYLKFEVFGLDGVVKSAKVRLYVGKASSGGGSISTVSNNYLNSTTPWTESGINWVNAPSPAGPALSTLGPVLGGTWVEFDVTPAVQGNGIYSFAITNALSSVFYNSKEAAGNRPVLAIEISK